MSNVPGSGRAGRLGLLGLVLASTMACAPSIEPGRCPTATASIATLTPVSVAQTAPPTVQSARELAQHSSGEPRGRSWIMSESGFVGTYLEVEKAGKVHITLRAEGHADQGAAPRVGLVVADVAKQFDVTATPDDYELVTELPEGTYFVRAEFENGSEGSRELTFHEISVEGAHLSGENSDALALASANTYIEHFRRGRAELELRGVESGSTVQVRLVRHAFNFGTNVPYSENQLIPDERPLPERARRFQKMLLDRFNTVVLSNGGKWLYHESIRDRVDLGYVDRFLDFAEQHGLTARMHTMLWDTNQEPTWVASNAPGHEGLLTRALRGDPSAKRELTAEIDERIEDYVAKRAARYAELDVLNESLHKNRYWRVYGAEGVAEIFSKTAHALAAAGAKTRLYLNEYNLLQWSHDPLSGRSDPYANWYRAHAQAILRAGGHIDGLGIQYYADARGSNELASNVHSPARIMQVLQNLSSTGLRLSLTEFAVNRGRGTPEQAGRVLEDTLRMVFGTPSADSFLIWAIWEGAAIPPPVSALFDEAGKKTVVGEQYDRVMKTWSTDVEVKVGERGEAEFVGFFGDYEVRQGNRVARFSLSPDSGAHSLTLTTR